MSQDPLAVLDANLDRLSQRTIAEAEAALAAGLSVASQRDGFLILETRMANGTIDTIIVADQRTDTLTDHVLLRDINVRQTARARR